MHRAEYANLYWVINDGNDPLKTVRSYETKCLTIDSDVTNVSSILNQWLELKTLFSVTMTKEVLGCWCALWNVQWQHLAYLVKVFISDIRRSMISK